MTARMKNTEIEKMRSRDVEMWRRCQGNNGGLCLIPFVGRSLYEKKKKKELFTSWFTILLLHFSFSQREKMTAISKRIILRGEVLPSFKADVIAESVDNLPGLVWSKFKLPKD